MKKKDTHPLKKWSLLLLLALLLVLAGCGKDVQWWEKLERDDKALQAAADPGFQVEATQREDLAMTLHSVTPTGIQVTLTNRSEYSMYYGEDYTVLRQVGGYWVPVPPMKENVGGFDAISYTLPQGQEITLTVDWEWWLGELPAGTYRFFKSAFWGTLREDVVLAVDFTIE